MSVNPLSTYGTTSRGATCRLAGWVVRGLFIMRAAVGIGLLGIWVHTGWPSSWDAWKTAVLAPSAATLSYDEQRAALPEGTLNVLMSAARTQCPPAEPILVLSDDPIAWLQGNYLLYPRRLDVIQSVDGFTTADLDTHTDGCLLSYGPERARLGPFRARLIPITCPADDCVYRIIE